MRQKIFDMLAAASGGHPWIVLIVGLVLTIVAGGLSENLRMETRVLDLVPADDPAAIEYEKIIQHYSSASQIIVGIQGKDQAQMIAFADEIKRRAKEATYKDKETNRKVPYVKRVDARADVEFIQKHGLMLTKVRDLENLDELHQDLNLVPLLTAYNDFFEREYIEDSGSVTEREKEDNAINGIKNLVTWLEGIEQVEAGGEQLTAHVDQATDLLSTGNPYMFSGDDELLLVMITPMLSMDRIDESLEGVESLYGVMDDIATQYKSLTVRMTGMPALMYEEMFYVEEDMGISSLVSLVLVLALFILAFRMWTAPILAIINLILGIIWTAGFIALTIGRLNLFTLMFAVILIGLGIDFAIHLNAGFSTARSMGKDVREALKAMFDKAGPGVITGAITTACAFLALALTGLEALVELGVVLGAGILLTLLASLTCLPAMYVIHAKTGVWLSKGKKQAPKPVRLAFPFLAGLGRAISKRPWPILVLFLLVTVGFGWYGYTRAEFEPDTLEIEPEGMPSVLLHKDILKRFEIHPDYTMAISKSLDETRPIVKKMKKNRLVGRVDAITEFVPSEKEQKKRARIAKSIRGRMQDILNPKANQGDPETSKELSGESDPDPKPKVDVTLFLKELDRLDMNVQEIGQLAFASVKKRLHGFCDRVTGGGDKKFSVIVGLKNRLAKKGDLGADIGTYQEAYVPKLAAKLEKMADTTPITLDTLPESIRERYMSKEGSNLITIYSSVDLWHEGKTELFLNATKNATDRVTGTAVLVDRLITLIAEKGLLATLLALGAIFIILLIDFRHLGYALLGMVPLLAGFAWMIGIFVLMGRKFDVANVEALPLILGIGIDDAVHVLHAVRRQGVNAMPNVLRHTGRALLLTSLTTAIAFGSIAFASHRGMAGMGELLVLGVVSCFITSVVLLPALMRIFFKNKPSNKIEKEARHA